jgi:hypothetical protein
MHRRFCVLTFLVFLQMTALVNAQTTDSLLDVQINTWNKYASNRPQELYLMLDKAIYQPNENINFSAMLLFRGQDTAPNRTLYLAVISLAQQKVVASDRFIIVNGISRGYITIPDSVTKGEYLLMAYTNNFIGRPGKPPFCRQISIRSSKKTPFDLFVSAGQRHDSIDIHCRVTTDYGGLAAGGVMQYSIGADSLELTSGKQKMDAFGEVIISLPARDTLAEGVVLRAQVERDKHTSNFWLPLTLCPHQVAIRYYPEGGSLVEGRNTTIGIEIRKASGMGIAAKGVLLENGKELAPISTDDYGLGYVRTILHADRQYSVKLLDLEPGDYLIGHFPTVRPNGFSLQVLPSIHPDSLTIQVQGPGPGSRFYMLVYNDRDIFFNASVRLLAQDNIGHISLPTKDWPGGVAKVSIFDTTGQPLADRAVYIPGHKVLVDISSDSLTYHTRSTVTVKLRLHDENGNGVQGIFSLSSILTARLGAGNGDISTATNIDRFLTPDHGSLPSYYYDSPANMDLVMLTQFHPVHPWAEVTGDTTAIVPEGVFAEDFGSVRSMYSPDKDLKKKLKQPIDLVILGSSVYRIQSDSFGRFQIPYQALVRPIGSKNPILAITDKRYQEEYDLDIRNAYDTVNVRLAKMGYAPKSLFKDSTVHEEQDGSLPFNAVRNLKQVVIKAGGNDEYEDVRGGCQDYVCMYNVLNCETPGHKIGSTRPMVGREYTYRGSPSGRIIYMGCMNVDYASTVGTVKAIHEPTQDHYYSSRSNLQSFDPITLSTLYWAPDVSTDKNGEATITFYTNDLKGRFYVIAQGISTAGTFSGRATFRVE